MCAVIDSDIYLQILSQIKIELLKRSFKLNLWMSSVINSGPIPDILDGMIWSQDDEKSYFCL